MPETQDIADAAAIQTVAGLICIAEAFATLPQSLAPQFEHLRVFPIVGEEVRLPPFGNSTTAILKAVRHIARHSPRVGSQIDELIAVSEIRPTH